ncbi:NAD-dependent epimerase/dehydratase family protein [Sphingomonas sp. CCH5-D11]|uniref:NAD-dependent epimerase/dehydratase family protein n=1 Tax=Sphingomonas sp. CCH5-D11 TaxID=1768786 RepID=UPI0008348A1C|nr:NAD-dependent epimerase/dehydratase family protein [Sphingomonas sp. CCH5-D11]
MILLVTGAAGFIGAHVCRRLLDHDHTVIGLDNYEPYYDIMLKHARTAWIGEHPNAAAFSMLNLDLSDNTALDAALKTIEIDGIVHLAAQAGVRYSLENPRAYIRANVAGHLNMLELARHRSVRHMVYASSSSVYGGNRTVPFKLEDRTDHPVSLYAATKRSDELMSETYSHLYRIPQTGLRFFTVYGPWGRPDMAVWLFTQAILSGKPIRIFNQGEMMRDFTYIDDIVTGIVGTLVNPPKDDGLIKPGGSISPHNLYNIGNSRAEKLETLIQTIERTCGREAVRDYQPMQPGDVVRTFADVTDLQRDVGFEPSTAIEAGIPAFVEWYRGYTGQ